MVRVPGLNSPLTPRPDSTDTFSCQFPTRDKQLALDQRVIAGRQAAGSGSGLPAERDESASGGLKVHCISTLMIP